MNNAILTAKLLALVEGKETPESWLNWWSDHESELETLLSRGEFLSAPRARKRTANRTNANAVRMSANA